MKYRAAVIVAAIAAALVPLPPALVERVYSKGVYPWLQRALTAASNLASFALLDALILVTAAAWLVAILRDTRARPWRHVMGRMLLRTVCLAAAFYMAFLVFWGLNYRRARLTETLVFDYRAITVDAARWLTGISVDQLNAQYERAHEIGWAPFGSVAPSLAEGFTRVQRDLGIRGRVVAGRPKATLLNPYFRRAGVAGMTDPYFLETLVERSLLPFERPFVIAHEWSHLAGFADESEANFVGWLICLRGSAADHYSGWLFLYSELATALRGRDRAEAATRLGPGPRADLRAITNRLRQQVSPPVAAAGWRVYDQYLKANRVEAGAASYAQVVRLVLGVRFAPGWTPVLRATEAE